LDRISLACRSSRTSRASAVILSATSVGTPVRLPQRPRTSSPADAASAERSRSSPRLTHSRPAGGVIAFVIDHHTHRVLAYSQCKLVHCLVHTGSTLSGVGASGKPGAVHYVRRLFIVVPAPDLDLGKAAPSMNTELVSVKMLVTPQFPSHRGFTSDAADVTRPWRRYSAMACSTPKSNSESWN
jgi:hypothetical protein